MTDATRRLTDIKFEHEGAHVALVGKHQGGPANGVTTLIMKATSHLNPADVAAAVASAESVQSQEDTQMEQIEKSLHESLLKSAVADAVAIEKAAGESAVAEIVKAMAAQEEVLKAAQEEIKEFVAKAAAQVQEVRKAKLSEVLPADQVESVLKALEALSDESFGVALAGYAVQKAAADTSDMLGELGANGVGTVDSVEIDRTTAILKAKYGVK